MTTQILIEKTFGLFLGHFPDNQIHYHYPVELCISLGDRLEIKTSNTRVKFNSCIIGSNVQHKHLSKSPQLSILLSPLTGLGLHYSRLVDKDNILSFVDDFIKDLRKDVIQYINRDIAYPLIINSIQKKIEIKDYEYGYLNSSKDSRILDAIKYLQNNSDKVISLQDISSRYHLSSSRFLHLFKIETQTSFRKIQIWNKLAHSVNLFQKNMTFTEIAHECGFTDSAHFCKKFKEIYGLSPKHLKTAALYNFTE